MLFPGRKQAVPAVYPVAKSQIAPESGIITAPVAVLALEETVAVQLEKGLGEKGYPAADGGPEPDEGAEDTEAAPSAWADDWEDGIDD